MFTLLALGVTSLGLNSDAAAALESRPNIVIVFIDFVLGERSGRDSEH